MLAIDGIVRAKIDQHARACGEWSPAAFCRRRDHRLDLRPSVAASFFICEELVRVPTGAFPPCGLGLGFAVVDVFNGEARTANILDLGDDPGETAEFFGRNRRRDRHLPVSVMPLSGAEVEIFTAEIVNQKIVESSNPRCSRSITNPAIAWSSAGI